MRLPAALCILALAACNPQPAAYTPDVERNFVTACEAQGSSSELCACAWERIEAEISPGDLAALERMPGPQREAHPLSAQINGYVEVCNASLAPQLPGADEQVPPP